jgi:hypothetical protein
LLVATGCSDSVDVPVSAPPTTVPCAPTTVPAGEKPNRSVVPVDGVGDRTVGLPAALSLPVIVHARHKGKTSFVVSTVDVTGKDVHVLASALGKYDGTFPVGFVDECATPTAALHIATKDPWHLDISSPVNAPTFATGVAGKGDAVFVYVGKAVSAEVSYKGGKRFSVVLYAAAGPRVLAQSAKAYTGKVSLPKGALIAVAADGDWSIRPA